MKSYFVAKIHLEILRYTFNSGKTAACLYVYMLYTVSEAMVSGGPVKMRHQKQQALCGGWGGRNSVNFHAKCFRLRYISQSTAEVFVMPLNFVSCSEFFHGFLHLVFQNTCLNVSLQYKNNSFCLINVFFVFFCLFLILLIK